MNNNKEKWFGLNVLRAFACIWVVVLHLEQNIQVPEIFQPFCKAGSAGVQVFFVLSGFFAYHSLDYAVNQKCYHEILKWWKRRAVKILPLYYIIILLYFVYFSMSGKVPMDQTGLGWLRYLLFLNQWIPTENVFWSNLGAVWTISVFVLFYLVAPIYCKFIKNYYSSWLGCIVLFLMAKWSVLYAEWMRPLQFMFFFAIGVMAYMAIKEKKEREMIAVLCLLVLILVVNGSDSGLFFAFIAAIYIGGAYNLNITNIYAKKIINYISNCSYSIYLVHAAVITFLSEYNIKSDFIYMLIFCIGTIGISSVAYYIIEVRLYRKLVEKHIKR